MAGVELKNITIRYGAKTIVKDLDLTIEDGECFSILGPSACGKTSLLRAICGFEKLVSGNITIGDKTMSDKALGVHVKPENRNIGVVFQDYAVWPHMTVEENIYYPLKKRRISKQKAHDISSKAIEDVKLAGFGKRLPFQLSGGQQQRVALARALVSSEGLLLLDEPLCNLDANLREEMRFEIKSLQRKTGITVLYVTHDQEVAMAISDRVALMDKAGTIRQTGTPEELYRQPADGFVYRFLGLSNFMPLEVKQDKLVVFNGQNGIQESSLVFDTQLPPHLKTNRIYAACRPKTVKLSQTGQLKGLVTAAVFLGNVFEYRVDLGGNEIRVQQDSYDVMKNGRFEQGQSCGLKFEEVSYYDKVEEV